MVGLGHMVSDGRLMLFTCGCISCDSGEFYVRNFLNVFLMFFEAYPKLFPCFTYVRFLAPTAGDIIDHIAVISNVFFVLRVDYNAFECVGRSHGRMDAILWVDVLDFLRHAFHMRNDHHTRRFVTIVFLCHCFFCGLSVICCLTLSIAHLG